MFKLLVLMWSVLRFLPFMAGDAGDDDKPEKVKPSELVDRYSGDAVRMAQKLADVLNENFEYRQKNTTLTIENKDLKSKLPAADAVVLTKDDASDLARYRELGKLDEVKDKLKTGAEAAERATKLTKEKVVREVAEAEGYKAPVLERLGDDLTYEVKPVTETINGKQVERKRAFVKLADGKEEALATYAGREWKDFLPSLTADPIVAPVVYGTPPRNENRTGHEQQNGTGIVGPTIRL